jgi:ABC-type transport system involved in cytochrome bd biosynthesis fused ATPase/permease subunit
MAAIFVVVVEVRAHKPNKMMPVKDDHMIEQLLSAAADPSLRDAVLLSRQLHPIGTIPHKYFRLLIPFILALARNICWLNSGKIGAKTASTIMTLITVSGLSPLAGLALCQSTRS